MSDAKFFVWLRKFGTENEASPQFWHGDQTKGTGQFQRGKVGEGDLLDFVKVPDHLLTQSLDEVANEFPYQGVSYHYSNYKARRNTVTA